MKKSKITVIVSLLLAVSLFGAACKSGDSSKKRKSTKKTKIEATDDEDETKKTKKTKKTKNTEDQNETEAPSETTEATTTTSETTEMTTTTESTEATSDTTPADTSDSAQTSGAQGTFEMPAPNTDGYKAISAADFTSIQESKGYTVDDAMALNPDVKAKALLLSYDPSYQISFIYYQYNNVKDAKAAYEEAIGISKTYQDKDYEFFISDNTMISYSEGDNEYLVVVVVDDMELLALTDTNTANINSMNEMLAELGYPIT